MPSNNRKNNGRKSQNKIFPRRTQQNHRLRNEFIKQLCPWEDISLSVLSSYVGLCDKIFKNVSVMPFCRHRFDRSTNKTETKTRKINFIKNGKRKTITRSPNLILCDTYEWMNEIHDEVLRFDEECRGKFWFWLYSIYEESERYGNVPITTIKQ